MKNLKSIIKDKEGVSPVIGVILMVAITVIMAAIVAGFVFGVISTPEATPTTSVTYDDHNSSRIWLLHQSGDSLNTSDLRVTLNGTTNDVTVNWNGPTWEAGTIQAIEKTGGGDVNTGDVVRIIHVPSGNVISQIEVPQ